MSKVLKALADPTRQRVLELLRASPMSAGDLADHFTFSKPTMSAHYAVLKEAGLIEGEKTGKQIIYRLKMSVLEETLLGLAKSFGVNMQASENDQKTPSVNGRLRQHDI